VAVPWPIRSAFSSTTAFWAAVALTLASSLLLIVGVNSLRPLSRLLGAMQLMCCSTHALLNPRTTQTSSSLASPVRIPPGGSGAAVGMWGLGGWWLFSLVMLLGHGPFLGLGLLLAED